MIQCSGRAPLCDMGAQQGWLGFRQPFPAWTHLEPVPTSHRSWSFSFRILLRPLNADSGALVPSSGTRPSLDVWTPAAVGPQPLAWPEAGGRQ